LLLMTIALFYVMYTFRMASYTFLVYLVFINNFFNSVFTTLHQCKLGTIHVEGNSQDDDRDDYREKEDHVTAIKLHF
jgi:hypothetical protein